MQGVNSLNTDVFLTTMLSPIPASPITTISTDTFLDIRGKTASGTRLIGAVQAIDIAELVW